MFFRAEPRIERYAERLPPISIPHPRRENHANRVTANALNALAVGAISAVFFLPNGNSKSDYTGEALIADGTTDGAISRLILTLTGRTEGDTPFFEGLFPQLEQIAWAAPLSFVGAAIVLHWAARRFANRQ